MPASAMILMDTGFLVIAGVLFLLIRKSTHREIRELENLEAIQLSLEKED